MDELLTAARSTARNHDLSGPHSQFMMVQAASGKTYHTVLTDTAADTLAQERAFLRTLQERGEERILKMVCLWQRIYPDLPSLALRKLVCDLDPQNKNAQIVLQGEML